MNKIRKAIEFISHGIWLKDDNEYTSPRVRWAVRQGKVLIMTAKGFGMHDLAVRSAALTFYTLMAIVPILALVFGVINGFGLLDSLKEYVQGQCSPNYSEIINTLFNFADNMLSVRTSGGIIAGVGFVVLLYSVVNVFSSIELAFNHIWEVRKQRSLIRKISDYTAVVIIAPVLCIASSSLWATIQRTLSNYTHDFVMQLIFGFVSMVIIWIMFMFIYIVLPNTKVKFSGALAAAIITGTIFVLFQKIYVILQSYITSYNAIYGSFAALPLFLIWLQTSWQILLIGAELSFAYQNVGRYEQELEAENVNYETRRKIVVSTMVAIVNNFVKGGSPMGSEEIADRLDLPVRIVRDVTFDLEKTGLIVAANNKDDKMNVYLPMNDISNLSLMDVIYRVEESGTSIKMKRKIVNMKQVETMFEKIKQAAVDSDGNVKLVDLIDKIDN